MFSTYALNLLAVYGLMCASITVLTVLYCFEKYFRRSLSRRRPPQDIESGQSSIPAGDQAMQRQPSQKQQAEGSRPIVVLYKNAEETESNCTDCAICLEEFKDGDCCMILPTCKHLYHDACINQWLVKDRHCPLCRGSVHYDAKPNTEH